MTCSPRIDFGARHLTAAVSSDLLRDRTVFAPKLGGSARLGADSAAHHSAGQSFAVGDLRQMRSGAGSVRRRLHRGRRGTGAVSLTAGVGGGAAVKINCRCPVTRRVTASFPGWPGRPRCALVSGRGRASRRSAGSRQMRRSDKSWQLGEPSWQPTVKALMWIGGVCL